MKIGKKKYNILIITMIWSVIELTINSIYWHTLFLMSSIFI